MPRPMFWLFGIVVIVLVTPIVFTAGYLFAREYGPSLAALLSSTAWAYIVGMTYISFRAIGKMFRRQ